MHNVTDISILMFAKSSEVEWLSIDQELVPMDSYSPDTYGESIHILHSIFSSCCDLKVDIWKGQINCEISVNCDTPITLLWSLFGNHLSSLCCALPSTKIITLCAYVQGVK